jgi:hypothetical protein
MSPISKANWLSVKKSDCIVQQFHGNKFHHSIMYQLTAEKVIKHYLYHKYALQKKNPMTLPDL